MWFFWSPINLINIVFCIVVVAVSFLAYKKTKDNFILAIMVTFAIFALSHYRISAP